MKKILAGLLTALVAFASGCSSNREITVFDLIGKPFGCTVDISVLGTGFSGEFIKGEDKSMSLTLSEPETLNGLTFGYFEDEISVSMFGLTVSLDTENSPAASAGNILFDLYSGEGKNSVDIADDLIVLTHEAKYENVFVEFDRDTKVPLRLYTEKSGIEMTYSDYRLI